MPFEQNTLSIRELAPGEVGEIVDSGSIVIPGYWQKPEETKHAIRNGWLYTDDVGKMDKDGWFYVWIAKRILSWPQVTRYGPETWKT